VALLGGAYEIVQQLIQDVTGKPFAEVTQELVLGPLQMKHSTYQQPLPERLWADATAYNSKGAGIPENGTSIPTGGGRFMDNAIRLGQSDSRDSKAGSRATQKTVELMNTPVLDHYGLGLQLML
jgi:CubicO group peptidase (beta-lactamase class C family)